MDKCPPSNHAIKLNCRNIAVTLTVVKTRYGLIAPTDAHKGELCEKSGNLFCRGTVAIHRGRLTCMTQGSGCLYCGSSCY
jgi:hypothetical protein